MKTIQLSILVVMFYFSNAQNITVNWGPSIKTPSKTWVEEILGRDEKSTYCLRYKKSGRTNLPWVEQYDKNYNLKFSKEIQITGTGGHDLSVEKIYFFNNKLLLFASYYNKEKDRNFLFAQILDERANQITPLKEVDHIAADKKRNSGSFWFTTSQDSSKILLHRNEPYEKGSAEKFAFKVFDMELNELWHRNVMLPYKEELFAVENYTVDNNGNVYILGQLYQESRFQEKKQPNYKYLLLAYSQEEGKFIEYDISLGDRFISYITVNVDNPENIIAAGYYSDENSYRMQGSFFMRISKETREIAAKSVKEFDKGFMAELMGERKAEKGKDLRGYELKKLILRDDAGGVLVAEYDVFYTVQTSYTDANGNTRYRSVDHYVNNSILLTSINPDGSIAWNKIIPKSQHTTNDGGLYNSYAVGVVGDKVYFIYNDHPKNIDVTKLDDLKKFSVAKKAVVMLVSVDASGAIKKRPLFSAKEQDLLFRPYLCAQTSPKEITVFGIKKSTYKFGKVSF